jgi:hypothetical protein
VLHRDSQRNKVEWLLEVTHANGLPKKGKKKKERKKMK